MVNMRRRAYMPSREAGLAQRLETKLAPPNAAPCWRAISFVSLPWRNNIFAAMDLAIAIHLRPKLMAVKCRA